MKLQVEPGQRFGRLTVVEETRLPDPRRPGGKRAAVCICNCEDKTAVTIPVGNLFSRNGRSANTQSCGCLNREMSGARAREAKTTHGLWQHPLYNIWQGMMARCYDPRAISYRNYGGRTDVTGGITVCPRWHDVAAFIEDIERLLGPRPEGMTLDRKRNGLGYKPSNIKGWATRTEQNRNQRHTKLTEANAAEIRRLYATGEWTQYQLADRFGVSQAVISKIILHEAWKTY